MFSHSKLVPTTILRDFLRQLEGHGLAVVHRVSILKVGFSSQYVEALPLSLAHLDEAISLVQDRVDEAHLTDQDRLRSEGFA